MNSAYLEDRLALQDLVSLYSRIPDDRDYTLVDRVFTADAVLVGPGFEYHGAEQIAQGMRGIEHFPVTLHSVYNQLVTVDGDEATGETYCVANHLLEKNGQQRKLDWGIRYQDRYRREANGWRLSRRELRVVWEQELPLQGDSA